MQKTTYNDFEFLSTLGKGAFSTVYLVKRKKDNKLYALKVITMERLSKIEQQNSLNEVRILSSINNPYIIAYKEAFWNEKDKTLNIVMEYCDDGDLELKIKILKRNRNKFDENLIWNYAIQILLGLKVLHDKKIIHRDLKSANVFLSKYNFSCKIGDLNVGKVLKKNKDINNNTKIHIGTPSYSSPEIWKKEKITYKSDIWSLGCIIYEMCCLKMPFKGKNSDELKNNICNGKYEKISSRYSLELNNFINIMLEIDPNKRPDCNMLLKNKIINDKLLNMSKISRNINNNDNDEESSIMDTIEYKNLWDLEKKIPDKKKYNKMISIKNEEKLELDETIKNESSYSEGSHIDKSIINDEIEDKNQKNKEHIKNYVFNKSSKKNNFIKNVKKELVIGKDIKKIKLKNNSSNNISYLYQTFKLKVEKENFMHNKTWTNIFLLNLDKEKIKQIEPEVSNKEIKRYKSGLKYLKESIAKKSSSNKNNNLIFKKVNNKAVQNNKVKSSRTNNLNNINKKQQLSSKIVNCSLNKKTIKIPDSLNEKTTKNSPSRKRKVINYCHFKSLKSDELLRFRKQLSSKNKYIRNSNNYKTNKLIINNTEKIVPDKEKNRISGKVHKSQISFPEFNKGYNNTIYYQESYTNTKDIIIKKAEKSKLKNNKNKNKINISEDFDLLDKKKYSKKNIQNIKLIEIDLYKNKNKKKAKALNTNFVLSNKIQTYSKTIRNISSKFINNLSISKTNNKV